MTFNKLIQLILESPEPTKFWGKRGAGVLIFCKSTQRFLLGLRSAFVDQPNTWGVFGGAIDGNESPNQAAIRELHEEIGYNGEVILHTLDIYRKGTFTFHNFIGIVPEEFRPKLDHETKDAKWFSLKDFPKNLHFGMERLVPILQKKNLTESKKILKEDRIIGLDLDAAYAIFYKEYMAATGKAWPKEKFIHKAQNWHFYGDELGYVAVRPQKSGFMKLVATAGNMKSKYRALLELSQSNVPLWGMVSLDIKNILIKKGFKVPNFIERTILKQMIEQQVISDGKFDGYTDDGGLIMELPGIGKVVKYFVGTNSYWKKLYSMKHLFPKTETK